MPSTTHTSTLLALSAATAADLTTGNPTSVREEATVEEAVSLLVQKGISAAPVIDRAGRPVGVLSRADILIHGYQQAQRLSASGMDPEDLDMSVQVDDAVVHTLEAAQVRDLMTPCVFSVRPETPAAHLIKDMAGWKVHRLFVVDRDGVLVGVISALDVLRHLSEVTRS